MGKYKNKYRIESTRLPFWDYGSNAAYFVTICTHHRVHFFGKIINGVMHFNEIGKIANQCWLNIPNHFPFVKLDAHVIMPNHVHGIIIIDKNDVGAHVETQDFASLHASIPKNKFGPQSKNLASIIRGYKIGVTKNGRKINPHFKWQPRYHDHIIRNKISFKNIHHYILNNPLNWKEDKFCNR